MEQTRVRTFVTFAVAAIFMLTMRWINQHWFISKPMSDSGFSYEMPRPKDARSAFDLSDRDVDMEVLENMEKNQADKAKKAAAAKGAVTPTAAKTAGKNAASSADHKPQITIDLVDTSRHMEMSHDGSSASHSETVPTSNFVPSTPAASSTSSSSTTQSAATLTPAEWEVLMHGSPSTQTIASFASAHESGQISDTDFYAIVFPMFVSSNTTWEATATTVMNDDNATNSLTYLSKEYQSITTAQRTSLWNIILGYASPVKFTALNTDLKSGYEPGISIGLQVLTVAVQSAQSSASSSSSSSSSSSGSRTVSGTVTGSSLEIFVPTLTSLETTDTQDASTASGLVSSINALNKN